MVINLYFYSKALFNQNADSSVIFPIQNDNFNIKFGCMIVSISREIQFSGIIFKNQFLEEAINSIHELIYSK